MQMTLQFQCLSLLGVVVSLVNIYGTHPITDHRSA